MIRFHRAFCVAIIMLTWATAHRPVQGNILYFDIPDVTLMPPTQGSVTAGVDFLLDGSDDFVLTLTRETVPGGDTQTSLTLGGTFPMASVFVTPDAGGPGVHHLTKFSAGNLIGTPQNDIRRPAGLAFRSLQPAGTYTGDWGPQAEVAFAGLAIDGFVGPNYGWARIGIDPGAEGAGPTVTLFDFAFEGIAFRPISAGAVPEPGITAGMGAILAAAILARKRKGVRFPSV